MGSVTGTRRAQLSLSFLARANRRRGRVPNTGCASEGALYVPTRFRSTPFLGRPVTTPGNRNLNLAHRRRNADNPDMTRRHALLALLALMGLFAAIQLLSRWLQPAPTAPQPAFVASAPALVDPRAPSAGPANAAVTIILFSDYACPACRALHPDLQALLARHPDVRIVYRDWPVFGPAARQAARLAIASTRQNRHAAFDDALMRSPGLTEPALRAAATQAGVDWPRLQTDLATHSAEIDALLADTDLHARALGFVGTPMLLVGPYLVTGRVPAARLETLIAEVRKLK